jgi:hypothetical protein
MSDDAIFDRYSRGAKSASPASASDDDIFSRYDRKGEVIASETPQKRIYVSPARPRGDVADMSGFNNRMVSSIPVVGPLFDKATAAAGAAVQPLVSEEARKKTFGQRYSENLATQDEANRRYGEEHPIAAPVADVTGATMALGPMSQTGIGARMMGLTGNSLGARVYQGAAGMGALETANQLLKGNNPLDQGFFGPVPLAMAGGAAGPMVGEGISKAGNALLDWMPRTSGPLAGSIQPVGICWSMLWRAKPPRR